MKADPLLILIALHVASGIVAVACGVGAMLTGKGSRRHRRLGRAYVIVLVLLCGTAAILAGLDWAHRWPLIVLGAVALSCAAIGYGAVRLARPARIAVHLSGMGVGYIAMLTAFYVDNGPRLPVWSLLPPLWLWLLPAALGVPLIVRAILRLARTPIRPAATFEDFRQTPLLVDAGLGPARPDTNTLRVDNVAADALAAGCMQPRRPPPEHEHSRPRAKERHGCGRRRRSAGPSRIRLTELRRRRNGAWWPARLRNRGPRSECGSG